MATLTGVAGTLPLPGIATVANPGAAVSSSDQQVTAQQLLNQDATLEAAVGVPGSITRMQETDWVNETTGKIYSAGSGVLAPGEDIAQTLRLPQGATITSIKVWIDPQNAVMPGTRATVLFRKVDCTTGTGTVISGPLTDPNTTTGTYLPNHAVELTGLSEVVDRLTTVYVIRVTGEAGGNEADIICRATEATYTTDWPLDRAAN